MPPIDRENRARADFEMCNRYGWSPSEFRANQEQAKAIFNQDPYKQPRRTSDDTAYSTPHRHRLDWD